MEYKTKNIKISEKHHKILKSHCEKTGLKMYRVIEKWIDGLTNIKKEDIYGETMYR
jgi:hypothetical protein